MNGLPPPPLLSTSFFTNLAQDACYRQKISGNSQIREVPYCFLEEKSINKEEKLLMQVIREEKYMVYDDRTGEQEMDAYH